QRLEDLDTLLLPHRELPDPGPRVDREPVTSPELGNPSLDGARLDPKRPPDVTVVTEHHVLRDGESLDQAKVLVHHADPAMERIPGSMERNRLAVELELALVGPVQPGEDVRERALAG